MPAVEEEDVPGPIRDGICCGNWDPFSCTIHPFTFGEVSMRKVFLVVFYLVSAFLLLHADVNSDLFASVKEGKLDDTKRLLDAGANPNVRDTKYAMTVLQAACSQEISEIAKLLIERGADIHDKDRTGVTVLMYAAMSGQRGTRKTLDFPQGQCQH
ncbi:MAG: ankyrin repeat domain-containing protein [Rhodopseudomonas palustris]|nr:ankyrin repeat domain-containing protein [Rhodopseudomonas palustris]